MKKLFLLTLLSILLASCMHSTDRATDIDGAPETQETSQNTDATDSTENESEEPDAVIVFMVNELAAYTPLPKEDEALLSECSKTLLGDMAEVKQRKIYHKGTFSVIIYSSPNPKKLTKKELNASRDCAQLGDIVPIKTADEYILWWSPLGCGFEVGEYFGNATVESRVCEEFAHEISKISNEP